MERSRSSARTRSRSPETRSPPPNFEAGAVDISGLANTSTSPVVIAFNQFLGNAAEGNTTQMFGGAVELTPSVLAKFGQAKTALGA